MSEAIQLYNRIQDPIAACQSLGKPFAVMFGLTSEQGTFLALASLAENKSPFELLRTYHVIDGKLSKKALVIYAEFRSRGGKVKWLDTGKDGKKAEAEFTFEGQTVKEAFTIEEAQRQGLIRPNSNWVKTPANMLRARVLSNAIAMLCPEIVAGVGGNPEDDENAPPEAKPLLPTQPAAVATAPEVKPAKVTEVKTVEPAPAPPAPVAPGKPVVSNWANPRDPNKISAEGARALESLIPADKAEAALRWMENKNWIPPKGSLLDLSPKRATLIYDQPEAFLSKIGGAQ